MIHLPCNSSAIRLPKSPLFHKIHHSRHAHRSPSTFRITPNPSPPLINFAAINSSNSAEHRKQQRTLFPGGFKRPEIKVPTLVLRLNADEVLRDKSAVDVIDVAVSKTVGVIVLNDGDGSGGMLYEAACLLKSVVRDRAYLLIAERVDIASAVSANGVVLSDQGLPAIIARNMMMESKSESVNLPIIARNVQTANSALYASSSEGADFIILGNANYVDVPLNSICQQVKVPVFTMIDSLEEGPLVAAASNFLQSGASGFVISLEDVKLFDDPILSKLFSTVSVTNKRIQDEFQSSNKQNILNADERYYGKKGMAGFTRLEEREKKLIEIERLILLEAIAVIRKAAPLMEEISLLVDAVSRLNEPFLLVIVGEFNSGKSTVINALLGRRYLKEGVVPTTNEITLLCYSEIDSDKQERCERHPDGQFICYLPAPFLKEINVVDTPGTNVILQRQQRLTEEFVPRADLLLFVISADRPLTESEVAFLRYIQQWKKKVVFVLNKSDIYQNARELEEATAFIKENAQMLLNAENVTLYPVSARSALEAKLAASSDGGNNYKELLLMDPRWKTSSFNELEIFLFSFLDRSTDTGMERMRLKLETPIGIAGRLLTACQSLVREEFENANRDLLSVMEILNSVKDYTMKLENESVSWRKQTLSLIDTAKARAVKLVDTTLQLSNLDLVGSYVFKGENSGPLPATSKVKNDIISPAFFDVQRLLGTYMLWLQSNNDREVRLYKESFEKRWSKVVDLQELMPTESNALQVKGEEHSMQALNNFSATLSATCFEQEVREVVLGTFGGLGAAGLSASLLTSVLPTTLEDLLALGLCSAGGLLAISNFPVRRKEVADKVKRAADALARELEEAMNKDLLQTTENLKHFVECISRPYQDSAQHRLNRLSSIEDELTNVDKKLRNLQIEIQNLHVS